TDSDVSVVVRPAEDRQCVFALRPSNNPAAARANAPVQTLTTRRHRRDVSTIWLSVPADKSGSIRPPVTTSVSSTAAARDAAGITTPRATVTAPLSAHSTKSPLARPPR